jgi:hypothetical protein
MGLHWLKGDVSLPLKRITLDWAVAILVILILPLSLYLGKWNFALWVGFIVWAEYFTLGGNVSTWKVMIPSLPFGAGVGAAWCTSAVALSKVLAPYCGPLHAVYFGYALTNLFWIPFIIRGLNWTKAFTVGSLAVFNGFTLLLAVYFTRALPSVGPMENPYYVIWLSFLWTVLMSYLGWFFGWLTALLTFPRKPD